MGGVPPAVRPCVDLIEFGSVYRLPARTWTAGCKPRQYCEGFRGKSGVGYTADERAPRTLGERCGAAEPMWLAACQGCSPKVDLLAGLPRILAQRIAAAGPCGAD